MEVIATIRVVKLSALLIFAWLCLQKTTHAAVRDSLKPGEVLDHSNILMSAQQKFCLKFTTVGFDTSFTYLVIDRTNTSTGYVDWIANRNDPISNNSGVLTLNHSGALIITRQNGEPTILYSPVQATNRTIATLLDSGNLVLREIDANGSTKRVLWQSFEHPSSILLPGMKLGVNKKTGMPWFVMASISRAQPASGSFTLEWEPRERQLIIKRPGQVYWASGLLRNKRFEHIPEEAQLMYEYNIVSNEDEESFSYTCQNDESQWVLYHNGQLQDTTRASEIARADFCYGYNTEGGCQRWEQPTCRHPGDIFDIRSGYFDHSSVTGGFVAADNNASLSASDCKAACWTNCTCVGFTTIFPNGTGCRYYHGTWEPTYVFSADVNVNILVRKNSDRRDMKKWIGALTATALTIICLGIFYIILRRRKAALEEKRTGIENKMLKIVASDRYAAVGKLLSQIKKGNDLRVFSYASIMAVTNRFSIENKLGEGGFGPVYKGKLATGEEVAIKRLSRGSGQGVIEFKNELTLISELQHMNLVQLLGCCIHGEERMLIYEYMANKSLDIFLFDCTRSMLLDWKRRFNIIEGIAQGLLYLHKYSRLKVVHRDLKASNILLDENMNPKISDFGMARIFSPQESQVNTERIVGTYGYMSPEYAMEGIFSIKSDVYSFGVLLLEIVSGRRNNSFYNAERQCNLIAHAWELWQQGQGLELVDPTLRDSCIQDQALRCIHVGLLCAEETAVDRPTMSDIIHMLTSEYASLPLPRRPAFYNGRKPNVYRPPNSSESYSVNGLSISNIGAR